MFWKKKIDPEILKYHFSKDKKTIRKEIETTNLGIGAVDIPIATLKKSRAFSNNDFKDCINEYFAPLLANHGFHGKDYSFCKENEHCFFIVRFFPKRFGGATQIDLLVKIKGITYPPKHRKFYKNGSGKYCEFSKRLAPINVSVWQWAFKATKTENKAIIDDMYRVFLEKGIPYFDQFENYDAIVSNISVETFKNLPLLSQDAITGFPSTWRDFEEELLPSIYFVFKSAQLKQQNEFALAFAKFGIEKYHEPFRIHQEPYKEEFERFIANN